MSKLDELVLCASRVDCESLLTNPLQTGCYPLGIKGLQKLMRRTRFVHRKQCETDPSHKQLIPYVMFRDEQRRILMYDRMSSSGEKRLVGKSSIGIGGHINPDDEKSDCSLFFRCVEREKLEELVIHTQHESQPRVLGYVNNEDDEVGSVHLGILVLFDLLEPQVSAGEDSIGYPRFVSLRDAKIECSFGKVERWSCLVLFSGLLEDETL